MSVTSQVPYKKYTAAPGAVLFATTFRVLRATDLEVRVNDVVITSGFTLSALGGASVDVTFSVPKVGGEKVELQRKTPLTRSTDYQQLGDFQTPVVNADFDRLWMAGQEMTEQIERSIRVPIGSGIDPDQLIADLTQASADAVAAAEAAALSETSAQNAASASSSAAGAASGSANAAANSAAAAAGAVLGSVLTGISFVSAIAVTAADTVLVAFGKLQAQITDLYTLVSASAHATGDIVDTLATTARTGFVLASGRTIGNAASTGTERANADTVNLFTLLWNSLSNTEAPVSGGRGASAAVDFAANKTITLPDLRGRVLAGKDNMGGTTANRLTSAGSGITGTTLGTAGGAETVTLSTAQLASHAHAQNFGSNYGTSGGSPIGASGSYAGSSGYDTGSAGSGNAHNNTQPTYIVNKIIKL